MELVLGKQFCLSRGIGQMTSRGPSQLETGCGSEAREFHADEMPYWKCTAGPEYSCSIWKPFALEYSQSSAGVSCWWCLLAVSTTTVQLKLTFHIYGNICLCKTSPDLIKMAHFSFLPTTLLDKLCISKFCAWFCLFSCDLQKADMKSESQQALYSLGDLAKTCSTDPGHIHAAGRKLI